MSHPYGKQTVLFVFRHAQQYGTEAPAIALHGAQPESAVSTRICGWEARKQARPELGAYLMSRGLNVNLRGDYDSTAVILERDLITDHGRLCPNNTPRRVLYVS